MKIGFIGCGNMASAMIGGIIKNQVVAPADILASAKTEVSREKKKEELGIAILRIRAVLFGIYSKTSTPPPKLLPALLSFGLAAKIAISPTATEVPTHFLCGGSLARRFPSHIRSAPPRSGRCHRLITRTYHFQCDILSGISQILHLDRG